MAVSGVKTQREVPLGPNIKLVSMESLPPSVQRGDALGQPYLGFNTLRDIVPSALISTIQYGPIFYRPSEGGAPSPEAWTMVRDELEQMDEARCLLTLLGSSRVAYRRSWVQPNEPTLAFALGSGTMFNPDGYFGHEPEVNETAAEQLAASYFRIGPSRRQKTLRIPLDRMDRVASYRDLTDKAIDLGIALEALLLHEMGGDQGELKFRLSLRGAWLGASTQKERAEIKELLGKVYDLRSKAVHTGMVAVTEENREKIGRGTELCKLLIRKTIDANANVDWNALVLGG
jgi:hypothetical protein